MAGRETRIPKGLVPHRRSGIHRGFSYIAHKRRNTRFNGLWRVHTPPQPLNAHTAAHRANGAGKRGAAQRSTFESTKICAKRFQIRDEEKPREQNNSRQTAAARQGRVDAVRRRRGPAGTRSPAAIPRFAPMGPTVFSVTATGRRETYLLFHTLVCSMRLATRCRSFALSTASICR